MTTTKEPPMVTIADLDVKSKEELVSIAEQAGLDANGQLASRPRDEVLNKVLQFIADKQGLSALGILETMSEGYGFLRQKALRPASGDVYVSQSQIRRFALKTGDMVSGQVRPSQRRRTLLRNGAGRKGQRAQPRRRQVPPELRVPDPHLPRRAHHTGDRLQQPHHQDGRPVLPNRSGTARPYRVAAQGRKDDGPQAHSQRRNHQLPRGRADGGADRGAA